MYVYLNKCVMIILSIPLTYLHLCLYILPDNSYRFSPFITFYFYSVLYVTNSRCINFSTNIWFHSQADEVETLQYIIQSSNSYQNALGCKEGKNKEKDKKSSILVEVMNAEVVRHPDYEVSLWDIKNYVTI